MTNLSPGEAKIISKCPQFKNPEQRPDGGFNADDPECISCLVEFQAEYYVCRRVTDADFSGAFDQTEVRMLAQYPKNTGKEVPADTWDKERFRLRALMNPMKKIRKIKRIGSRNAKFFQTQKQFAQARKIIDEYVGTSKYFAGYRVGTVAAFVYTLLQEGKYTSKEIRNLTFQHFRRYNLKKMDGTIYSAIYRQRMNKMKSRWKAVQDQEGRYRLVEDERYPE